MRIPFLNQSLFAVVNFNIGIHKYKNKNKHTVCFQKVIKTFCDIKRTSGNQKFLLAQFFTLHYLLITNDILKVEFNQEVSKTGMCSFFGRFSSL